jgi:uncharacterized protein (UPF0254 family)
MSTRAYRVEVQSQVAKDATWNVTRSDEINDALNIWGQTNDNGTGEICVTVEDIETMLSSDIELDTEQRAQFERDVAHAKIDGDEEIYYELF